MRPLQDVEQRQACLVFLSKRNGIRRGCQRLLTEIGREKNLIELGHTLLLAHDLGPNREDRARSLPEYLLGDGSHEQLPGAGMAATANHKQINVMLADKPAEHVPDVAYPTQCLVRYSSELLLKTRYRFLLQLFLPLNMSRPGFRRKEEVIVRRKDVGSVQPRPD
jgi:hypothetical protein